MRQPWVWAAAGALVLLVGIFAATRGGDDELVLEDARIETTGVSPSPVPSPTATEPETATALDLDDRGGLTDTVRDTPDQPVVQREAFLAVDPDEQCVWMVNVAGENPAELHVVAWPTGTEISWSPFEILVRSETEPTVSLTADDVVAFRGRVVEPESVDDEARTRLLGQESCGHDAVVVIDDDPNAVGPGVG